jgi:hypothetical protein
MIAEAREQDRGKGELDVGDAHDDVVDPAAEEAGNEPQQEADRA